MFRRKLTQSDLVRMGVPARYWTVSFDLVQEGVKGSPSKAVENYISKLPSMVQMGAGLLLWGPNGTGKTCIAVLLGKELRRHGLSVFFLEASSLKTVVADHHCFDQEQTVWDRAKTVDVLILDDLGKGVQDSTGFGLRLIDELIRHRNGNQLVTFVTTNMSLKVLRAEMKPSTMHSIKECMVPILVDGKDQREQTKSALLNQLMDGQDGP